MGEKLIKKYWPFILYLFLSIILPLIWLNGDYLFLSEEDNFANYQNVIYRHLYSWGSTLNKGNSVLPGDHITIIPNGIFYYALSSIGISNYVIQKIYLFLIILTTFLVIHLLLKLFTKKNSIIVAGVLFYFFNFYTKSTIFYSAKMFQLILLPFLFLCFYHYLEKKKIIYAILNFILLFIFQAIFINLATLGSTVIIYLIVIPFYIVKNRIPIGTFLKTQAFRIFLFLFLIIPILFYNVIVFYFSYIKSNTFESIKAANTFSALTSPLNLIFQIRGAWWEYASFEGVSYNPWLWFYDSPPLVIFAFVLIGIIIYPFYIKKIDRIYTFWFIVFLGSVFFASGASFYPKLYEVFYRHVPLFYIFREPWAKFTPVLMLTTSIMLALSLERLKNKKLIYVVLIILIIRSFPYFTPNFIDRTTKRWFIPLAKIPSHWEDYKNWSFKNREKTILTIPIDHHKRDWYKENLGNINHPLARLFGYTDIIYKINNNYLGSLIDFSIKNRNPNFIKIANIDYGLIQNDVATSKKDYPEIAQEYDRFLKIFFVNEPFYTFGKNKLTLHKIKPQYSLPRIYIPQDIIITGGLDELLYFISKPTYNQLSGIFLKIQNIEKTQIIADLASRYDKNSTQKVKLNYKKINPTKYTVSLKNTKGVIPLVFVQNYHPAWELSVGNSIDSSENKLLAWNSINIQRDQSTYYVEDQSHFVMNGFANSWFIDIDKICNDTNYCIKNNDNTFNLTLHIDYWPQKIFNLGVFLYIAIFLLISVYLLFLILKNFLV